MMRTFTTVKKFIDRWEELAWRWNRHCGPSSIKQTSSCRVLCNEAFQAIFL